MRVFLILLASIMAGPMWASSPEEVVLRYVTATRDEGLASAARFIHPDEIARFRATIEPAIVTALKGRRTRAAFTPFADPANPGEIRKFASDTAFLSAFITWFTRQHTNVPPALKQAEVTAIGHVDEGELCHVVLRIVPDPSKPESEQITLMSTKPHEGEPMLLLTPELERIMIPFTPAKQTPID